MRFQTIEKGKTVSLNLEPSFDITADVCVIGLGTAGAIAAISAAEQCPGCEKMAKEFSAFAKAAIREIINPISNN